MTSDPEIALAVASLLLLGLSALASRLLRHCPRRRLAEVCQRRGRSDLLGEVLRGYERVALDLETLRVPGYAALAAAAALWAVAHRAEGAAGVWSIAAGAAALAVALAAVEFWLPAAVVRLAGAPLLARTWPLWTRLARLVSPLALLVRFVERLPGRLGQAAGDPDADEAFEQEIRTLLSAGHREGLLEDDAREMIEGVIELGDATVSQIMTPRTEMIAIHVETPFDEAVRFVIDSGHARIPAYDKSLDDIVGILYSRDLLTVLTQPAGAPRPSLRHFLRECQFVPETKPVDDLLQEFQRTRNHMAVALDEYGGVSGLVTIEDVLEEIVGEIVDEYDTEHHEEIFPIDDRSAEALARVHVDEINARLHVDLPESREFDTIGGWVFHELGRIPRVGDQVLWKNVRVTVLEVDRRRLERVRIEVLDAESVTSDR